MKYKTLMKTGLALLLSVCTILSSILPVHATSQDPVVTTETVTDENAQNNVQTDTPQDDEGAVETEVSDTETSEADSNTVTDNGVDITDDKSDIAEDESDITIDSEDSSEKSSDDDISIEDSDDVTSISLSDEMKSADDADKHSSDDSCYIKAYEVSEVLDGTAPFDADNNAGNDSSNKNGIVRSFDTINYTLKYTTAIRDTSSFGVDESYVNVKFELPFSNKDVSFDDSTLNWCLNKTITYEYSDGSTSTTLDKSKDVVKQTLTGKRHLSNSEESNSIPGTGTLSVGLRIKAVTNGTPIQPTFTIWMEGNPESDYKTLQPDVVRASCAPKYNISVVSDSGLDYLGYYNYKTGEISSTAKDDFSRGRLIRYALNFQLYNDSADKGLKGIEFPKSDVKFDVTLDGTLNNQPLDESAGYDVMMWDYGENEYTSHGHWGKLTQPSNSDGYAYYGPLNRGGGITQCYNGGGWNMVQDESNDRLYHVTISDYEIDYENLHFPPRYQLSNEGDVNYSANVGCVSAGKMFVLSTFADSVDTTSTLYQDVQISNLDVKSVSDVSGEDRVATDNRVRRGITLYPTGGLSKYQRYCDLSHNCLATVHYAGDNISTIGSKITIESFVHGQSEFHWSDFNMLQKFDDEAIEIDDGSFDYWKSNVAPTAKIKILFAAKPDGTGWNSDKEMGEYGEENLIYFKTIDDLRASGYTCVGVLYEMRDVDTVPVAQYTTYFDMFVKVKVKADPSLIGHVYQTVSNVRGWRLDNARQTFSWLDKDYDGVSKAYGVGKPVDSSGYYSEYVKPYATAYSGTGYVKASYKDGVMYGHNGYWSGNSLLIVGDTAGVIIKNADKDGSEVKTVYDIDNGERTANFTVSPSLKIKSENAGIFTADLRDDVTVTVTLPKNIHYSKSSIEPVSVKENSDGTTTIIYEYKNQKLKEQIPPFSISTIIGEEGTKNDVNNNETFVLKAKVSSKNDPRAAKVENGNYSETQITVIKLAASAVTKRVLTPYLELNQDVKFKLRYSNIADADALNAKLYDILSWNGDRRGSNFHGKYKLKSVRFDFSKAPQTFDSNKSNVALSVSSDSRSQDKAAAENYLVNTTGVEFTKLLSASIDEDKREVSFSNLDIKDAKAIYAYLGKVFGHEYIDTYITLTPYDDGDARQLAGDVYANNFTQWADNQASTVVSNIVKAVVVSRDTSGYVWFDKNEDGVRQADEVMTDKVRVRIYRTDKSAFDKDGTPVHVDGKEVYEAFDIYGNKLNATDMMTDEHGYWHFSNLEAGEYYVTVDIPEKYHITADHKGEDTTVDSDAYETFNTVFIKNIRMPGIDNMTDKVYESDFNDTGLIRNTDVDIWKVSADDESNLIAGAKLALYNASDVNADNSIKQDAVPVDTWSTEAGVSKSFKNILTAGHEYVLVETDVPEGYEKASPVRFTVNEDAAYQKVVMVDEYKHYDVKVRKLNKQNELIAGAKMRVTGTEAGTNRKIEPVEWVTEADKPFTLSLRKGDYVLSEVEAPAGYLKAEDVKFSVDDKGHVIVDNKQVDTVDMVDSYVKPGSITVNKFDTDGTTPLSSVTYKLTFVKAKYPELAGLSDYKRLLKVGESAELTTDSHGRLVFENLDQGEYTLVETHTVKGHQLLKDEIKVTLPVVMSKAEAEDTNADVSKADLIDDEYHFYDVTYDVTNDYSFTVPMTGGANDYRNYLPILFGFAVLAMAYVCLNRKKKTASDMEE